MGFFKRQQRLNKVKAKGNGYITFDNFIVTDDGDIDIVKGNIAVFSIIDTYERRDRIMGQHPETGEAIYEKRAISYSGLIPNDFKVLFKHGHAIRANEVIARSIDD